MLYGEQYNYCMVYQLILAINIYLLYINCLQKRSNRGDHTYVKMASKSTQTNENEFQPVTPKPINVSFKYMISSQTAIALSRIVSESSTRVSTIGLMYGVLQKICKNI